MGRSFQKTPGLEKAACSARGGSQEPTSLEGEQVAMVEHFITKFVFCKEKIAASKPGAIGIDRMLIEKLV
jgi:hypothetical protein